MVECMCALFRQELAPPRSVSRYQEVAFNFHSTTHWWMGHPYSKYTDHCRLKQHGLCDIDAKSSRFQWPPITPWCSNEKAREQWMDATRGIWVNCLLFDNVFSCSLKLVWDTLLSPLGAWMELSKSRGRPSAQRTTKSEVVHVWDWSYP